MGETPPFCFVVEGVKIAAATGRKYIRYPAAALQQALSHLAKARPKSEEAEARIERWIEGIEPCPPFAGNPAAIGLAAFNLIVEILGNFEMNEELSSTEQDNSSVGDQGTPAAPDQPDGDNDGGLFGSGSEAEDNDSQSGSQKRRKLNDEELDSLDGQDKSDGVEEDDGDNIDVDMEERAETVLDVKLGRHAIPRPSDRELYLLRCPDFLGIEPKAFDPRSFQPPTTEHHSTENPSSTFSSYQTSNNTLRWRYSPGKHANLQSNTRVLRWSDGSFTLQLASNPREQFELTAKPLAPPQSNPLGPGANAANRGPVANGVPPYDARLDSHTYLAAPHESAGLIRITNQITASLGVQTSSDQDDDALARLQESLAAATKGNKAAPDGGLARIRILEDPELAKKKAEVAEKEKVRAQRRRQVQEERERDRANRVLGRSGLRTGGLSAGLTVGGLEDDDGMTSTRARPSKPKRKPRRRNSEYSDEEEEFRGRGRTGEDEYDEDDGFLVGSDEEPEIIPDESEEEVEMADGFEDEDEKPRKGSSTKAEAAHEANDEGATGGRTKKRRVIEEDEDED